MRRARAAWAVLLAAAAVASGVAYRFVLRSAPTAAELAVLEARRDALQRELDALVLGAGHGLARAPRADVLIGVPAQFTAGLVTQVVQGLFAETTLTLRGLRVTLSKDVRARLLLGTRTLGHLTLAAEIHEVRAVLEPGTPRLAFGGQRIAVTLPLRVAHGVGRTTLHVRWDSRGLAGAVCGDVEVHPRVSGRVVPADYSLAGAFRLATAGQEVLLTPEFDDLELRLFVQADPRAWDFLDQVVAGRGAVCRAALERVNLRARLEKQLGQGFKVKLPKKVFKTVRLPAGLEHSLELQGLKLTLQVVPTGLSVDSDRIWYGASVRAVRAAPAPVK